MKNAAWWKILLFVWMALCITAALIPPIAGNFTDVAMTAQMSAGKTISIKFSIVDKSKATYNENEKMFEFEGRDVNGASANLFLASKPTDFDLATSYHAEA